MDRLEEIREREPMTHELKCWPEYFAAVESGAKPFEVRKWDRPFRVGDILALKEYDPEKNDYSGAELQRKITYLLDMTYLPNDNIPHFAGYVVIGLESPEISRLTAERDAAVLMSRAAKGLLTGADDRAALAIATLESIYSTGVPMQYVDYSRLFDPIAAIVPEGGPADEA